MRKIAPPAWYAKAREFAARIPSPAGKPLSLAKTPAAAKLYLYDEIGRDPWSDTGIDAKDIIAALAEAKGAKALEVHINSPGGNVFEGVTVYNAIRAFDGPKTVYVDGIAASIASVIALAGDKVVTSHGAMWMIHEVAGGIFAQGTADDIEVAAKRAVAAIRAVQENVIGIYASGTGQASSDIAKWMAAETWMTAAEALERGFTDEVTSDGCGCECEECTAGDCADCTDECQACKDGGCVGCCAPEKKTATRALAPAEIMANVRAQVASARAQVVSLSHRFPGASPGKKPGQPGTAQNTAPGTRQKERKS